MFERGEVELSRSPCKKRGGGRGPALGPMLHIVGQKGGLGSATGLAFARRPWLLLTEMLMIEAALLLASQRQDYRIIPSYLCGRSPLDARVLCLLPALSVRRYFSHRVFSMIPGHRALPVGGKASTPRWQDPFYPLIDLLARVIGL